jgi:LmbE family N-acetylglucosaminyl deacetylase
MLTLEPALKRDRPLRVLCLGAHSDDIEIGCGGTILKLLENHANVSFHWVVFSSNKERKKEAEKSAKIYLAGAGKRRVTIKEFRDGFFPYIGSEIKEYFEILKREVVPDLVFTHYRSDLHQDHRLVSDLTWNTFRDHLILEYEIPKYDGDLGQPNVYVRLEESIVDRKIDHLMKSFQSQAENQWFTPETFRSMLRLRGIESNAKYAEAFYGRKLIL